MPLHTKIRRRQGLEIHKTTYNFKLVLWQSYKQKRQNSINFVLILCLSEENQKDRKLCDKNNLIASQNKPPTIVVKKVFEIKRKRNNIIVPKQGHTRLYRIKAMPNYLNINHKTLSSWTRNKDMTSEFETFTFAIKNQNIATKYESKTTERKNTNYYSECTMRSL